MLFSEHVTYTRNVIPGIVLQLFESYTNMYLHNQLLNHFHLNQHLKRNLAQFLLYAYIFRQVYRHDKAKKGCSAIRMSKCRYGTQTQ